MKEERDMKKLTLCMLSLIFIAVACPGLGSTARYLEELAIGGGYYGGGITVDGGASIDKDGNIDTNGNIAARRIVPLEESGSSQVGVAAELTNNTAQLTVSHGGAPVNYTRIVADGTEGGWSGVRTPQVLTTGSIQGQDIYALGQLHANGNTYLTVTDVDGALTANSVASDGAVTGASLDVSGKAECDDLDATGDAGIDGTATVGGTLDVTGKITGEADIEGMGLIGKTLTLNGGYKTAPGLPGISTTIGSEGEGEGETFIDLSVNGSVKTKYVGDGTLSEVVLAPEHSASGFASYYEEVDRIVMGLVTSTSAFVEAQFDEQVGAITADATKAELTLGHPSGANVTVSALPGEVASTLALGAYVAEGEGEGASYPGGSIVDELDAASVTRTVTLTGGAVITETAGATAGIVTVTHGTVSVRLGAGAGEGAVEILVSGDPVAAIGTLSGATYLMLTACPTTDPEIPGVVWSDGGILHISSGTM